MLPSGRELSCGRGSIHGSGEVWRPAEHPGEGAAPADDRAGRSSAQAITARILLKTIRAGLLLKWPQPWTSRSGPCSAPSGGTPRRGAAALQPSQPLPEAGRPWRGPPDSLGLQPGSGGPRLLDAACWRARRWSWDWPRPCPTRRCGCG